MNVEKVGNLESDINVHIRILQKFMEKMKLKDKYILVQIILEIYAEFFRNMCFP